MTRARVYARDGQACVHCGRDSDLTLDHIVPRAAGGTNAVTNLVTACRRCNSSRQCDRFPPADEARLFALAAEPLPDRSSVSCQSRK